VLVLPHSRFCLINAGVLYLYFSNYLQIDEEEYGGTWELTKEGFMTSFALFMVCVAGSFIAGSVHFMSSHLSGSPLIDLHDVVGVPFFKRLLWLNPGAQKMCPEILYSLPAICKSRGDRQIRCLLRLILNVAIRK
jgi:hypothetical protein